MTVYLGKGDLRRHANPLHIAEANHWLTDLNTALDRRNKRMGHIRLNITVIILCPFFLYHSTFLTQAVLTVTFIKHPFSHAVYQWSCVFRLEKRFLGGI